MIFLICFEPHSPACGLFTGASLCPWLLSVEEHPNCTPLPDTSFHDRYWTSSEKAGFVRSCLPQRCVGGADLRCEVGYAGPFCSSVSSGHVCTHSTHEANMQNSHVSQCLCTMNVSRCVLARSAVRREFLSGAQAVCPMR